MTNQFITELRPPLAAVLRVWDRCRLKLLLASAGLALAAGCSGGSEGATATPSPVVAAPVTVTVTAPKSILFVGNSFSTVEGNIDRHFKSLAASTRTPKTPDTALASRGGATLATLSQDSAIWQAVQNRGYDLVVLQDDIPEYGPPGLEPFKTQVRAFNKEVQAHGGKTALFMAWAYERLNWISMASIASAHKDIGRELSIPVAPVGLAFDASLAERPDLAMLGSDKEHETLKGVYLAACVIYGTLYQESPEGASYVPFGMTLDEAAFLQRIAWKSVSDWNAGLSRP